MKIIVIGSVKFSKIVFSYLINNKVKIFYILGKKKSDFNSDFVDLIKYFSKKKIESRYISDINKPSTIKWLRFQKPDLIICLGWSRLLKKQVLKIPKFGVIGYHPSDLPSNRGRHPIIWALALGLKKIASTFFLMNENADSGSLLSKKFIKILDKDDANTIYNKLSNLAGPQLLKIIKKIKKGNLRKIKQLDSKSNFWRKRNEVDGLIDWRMSATSIINLVRALQKPYIGAHFVINNKKIKLWSARKIESSKKNFEPGKVIGFKSGKPIIKCGENAIIILKTKPKISIKLNSYL